MKIAPVSADLLIKVALVAAGLGLVYWGYKKATGAAINALDGLGAVADEAIAAVNPADSNNLVNRAVTAVGSALVSDPAGPGKNADGSWTLGGWIYDKTQTSWAATTAPALQAANPNPTYDPTPGIY